MRHASPVPDVAESADVALSGSAALARLSPHKRAGASRAPPVTSTMPRRRVDGVAHAQRVQKGATKLATVLMNRPCASLACTRLNTEVNLENGWVETHGLAQLIVCPGVRTALRHVVEP